MSQESIAELRGLFFAARRIIFFVALFSLVINLLMLVLPFYMLQVYDRVLTSRSKDTLYVLTILAVSLLAISAALDLIRSRVLVRLAAKLERALTPQLFAALIRDRIATQRSVGIQSIRDLEAVRSFLTGPGLIAFFDAPWMPVFLTIIFLFHPWLGTAALVGAVTLLALAVLSEASTRAAWQQAGASSHQAHRFAESSLRNADAIWAMSMVGDLYHRWQDRYFSALGHSGAAADKLGIYTAIAKFVRPLLQIALLGLGAYLAIEERISAGAMIAASIIMGRALAPVEASIGHWRSFVNARSSYGRMMGLLRAYPSAPDRMSLPEPQGDVSVEAATVIPPGAARPALSSISFHLRPGRMLGVIGPSAAGKSSLARLLVGIWPPISGNVRLDGADLARWDRTQLGSHLGYLPQDVELFDGTVAENIARFQEVCPIAVAEAAQLANAHDMILRLPEGYETPIGEGGCVLSGGQRQRIGLARAIYKLPRFIVLDEPNANLDSEGELALRHTLRRLKEIGRTVVIISHRRDALGEVDDLLFLENGRIKVMDARDEVLKGLTTPRVVSPPQQRSSMEAGQR